MTLQKIRTARAMLAMRRKVAAGETVGLVATMGALHAGHLALVRRSVRENTFTVVSIYVNPRQFAPHEDFTTYPRNEKEDLAKLAVTGADYVYLPRDEDMYPLGVRGIYVEHPTLTKLYCGVTRPHFYAGGMTIVAKLFNMVLPTRAYFGKKDYQQYVLFRNLAKELAFNVSVVGCPTVRTGHGLALSSRNAYLTVGEQVEAAALARLLRQLVVYFNARLTRNKAAKGGVGVATGILVRYFKRQLQALTYFELDYVACADRKTLAPVTLVCKGKVIVLVAVYYCVGAARRRKVRLIDNVGL